MGLNVTFVSGPRRCGKSAVIETMLGELYRRAPHYLRLAALRGDKKPPPAGAQSEAAAPGHCAVASARWLTYEANSIYEVLPEALTRIHRCDRSGCVLIEADADPVVRNAYPYDRRVFIMPSPRSLTEVFRTVREAADALRHVLDDTAAFASEIYGMLDSDPMDDDHHEDRPEFTVRQMRGFLNSPLGEELATRIQFQPAYHGLVESDVVLINTGAGGASPLADECLRRIERLLARLRGPAARKGGVFCCDPLDPQDPLRDHFFERLRTLLDDCRG